MAAKAIELENAYGLGHAGTVEEIILYVTLVLLGLCAGLFVGWSVSVIPGTRRTSDETYIESMQRINEAIVNPPFLILFAGTALVLVASAVALFAGDQSRRAWWVTAAAVTYVVGMVGVTVGRNIPLNDALGRFELEGSDADSRRRRRVSYEQSWNRWHHVRSVAGSVAFGMALVAAFEAGE